MKKHSLLTALVLSTAVFFTLLVSCSKEEINEKSPADYITQSEQLSIPASVDLPVYPNGYTRVATYYAIGVQKYKAQIKAGSFPETYEWVFVAPRADLYAINNKMVGSHGAGPFWALTGGADSIFAQQFAPPRTSPSSEPNTIDWLLLKPKPGAIASGVFTGVNYIQRIATSGGKAPATLPGSITETIEVPYTAIYRFSKEKL